MTGFCYLHMIWYGIALNCNLSLRCKKSADRYALLKSHPRSTFVQLRVTTQNETFWVRFEHSASFFPTPVHIGIMHTANRRCVLSFAGLEIMLC